VRDHDPLPRTSPLPGTAPSSGTAASSGSSPSPGTGHPALARLDVLAASLSRRADVVAVLALGSAGTERDRFDDHSDLDVFVVVDEGAVARYVDDLSWLQPLGEVATSFRNERNGRKVLLRDGLFVEYAVLTRTGLAGLAFTGARTLWQRPDLERDLASVGAALPTPHDDTVAFHVGEAMTNLLVGLHRELRGERLTASRFIQVYAVDRLVALLRLTSPPVEGTDPFDGSRRVERRWGRDVLPLAELVPGYERNGAAARAVLSWLSARSEPDPVLVAAVEDLLRRVDQRG
jgi:hypothetical protein